MALTLTLATPLDLEAVHVLRREFYAEDASPWDESAAHRALQVLLGDATAGRVWVAVDEGETVGYAVLVFGYSLEFHGRDAFLDELYLRPSIRGKGIGAAALALAESLCREAGVHALHLEVHPTNQSALSLYRRWGFDLHDRQLMTKWLSPRPPSRSPIAAKPD